MTIQHRPRVNHSGGWYYTGEKNIVADLRTHLASSLPEYTVPAAFVRLDTLPLTPNGKIDRQALPAQEARAFGQRAYEAPEGLIEIAIARIWSEFLSVERIGRHDNFFELGGHSLLALRVIGRINQTLEVNLPVPAFFHAPIIARLATLLEQRRHVGAEPRLVRLHAGSRGLPLYFIGAGPTEHRLAKLISKDRTIYAVDAPVPVQWIRAVAAKDWAAVPSIEQLGARYGDVLHTHGGSSPCVIVGYSLHGKLAFEAAQVLRRAGGHIALVLLLDAHAFTRNGVLQSTGLQSLRRIWRGATETHGDTPFLFRFGISLGHSWRLLRWLFAQMPGEVKRKGRPSDARQRADRLSGLFDSDGVPIEQTVIDVLARIAGRAWRPSPIDVQGVLFRTKTPREKLLPGHDVTNGWNQLFEAGLEVVEASGNHVSMVIDENLETLAEQVSAVLDRYDAVRSVGSSKSSTTVRQQGGKRTSLEIMSQDIAAQ